MTVKLIALIVASSAALLVAACSPMTAVPRETERSSEEAAPAGGPPSEAADSVKAQVDFETEILPIVESCRPCHFEGGKMYARLPFDDPDTLRDLGEALFTRIRDEDEQTLLRAFFAQR